MGTREGEDRPSQRPTGVPGAGGKAAGGEGARAGDAIGGHELLRLRGAGGQGVVYEAKDAGTDRVVALKTLLPSASQDDLERFEREIDALAALDHECIPPLFERGMHAGRPWFTMRLVDGPTLVEHASARGLDARGVVELLLPVCDAVAHAHGRGVIHRDLKPDNIRVDASDRPQVLDFGLAKRMADETLTQAGAPLGTVAYAAPEMLGAGGRRADVRADVYSLGVVLYRMLAGRLPLEMPESLSGALEVVRTEEPERPSAHRRGVDADLDAICLKCLSKEPSERYASVLDLQRDLRRWLAGEPVEARGRARGYRLRKILWRHRWAVAGVTGAVAAVAAFVVTLVLQAEQLRAERDRSREEERKVRAMADAFTHMVEDIDPERVDDVTEGDDPSAQAEAAELIDRVGRRAAYDLDAEPRVRAAVMTAVGHAYLAIGVPPRAQGAYGTALGILSGLPDAEPAELLRARMAVATADGWTRGGLTRAEASLRAVAAEARQGVASPGFLAAARHELAEVLRRQGRSTEALVTAREALAAGHLPEDVRAWVATRTLEAALLVDLGEAEEALSILDDAEGRAQATLWRGHPRLARIDQERARALAALGRVDDAVAQIELAFARLERSYGAAHPFVVSVARDAAAILSGAGRHEEAARRLRDLLELQRIMLGTHDPETRDTLLNLASEVEAMGRGAEAECLRAEAAIVTRRLDLAVP